MKPAREPVDEYAETQVLTNSSAASARAQSSDVDTAALYQEYARELASGSEHGAPQKRRTR
jgi:hypothetical protein